MNTKPLNLQIILIWIFGIIVGIAIAGYVANGNMMQPMKIMGMGKAYNLMNRPEDSGPGTDLTMHEMSHMLDWKNGTDFDRTFIELMIPHHEGAIEMAQQANAKAAHEEIKQLSRSIAETQAKEIESMRLWYRNWYGVEVPNTIHK